MEAYKSKWITALNHIDESEHAKGLSLAIAGQKLVNLLWNIVAPLSFPSRIS